MPTTVHYHIFRNNRKKQTLNSHFNIELLSETQLVAGRDGISAAPTFNFHMAYAGGGHALKLSGPKPDTIRSGMS